MLWDWVPWELQVGLIIIGTASLLLIAVMVFGYERVRRFLLPAAGIVAALVMWATSRRQGWEAKVKKDLAAADKLIDRAARTRSEAERKMREDPDAIREDDGFRRPD